MKFFILTFVLHSLFYFNVHAQISPESCENESLASDLVLKPFETDKCTGYSEGPKSNLEAWSHCCIEHDLFMWVGGTSNDRKQADLTLRKCVKETGHNVDAFLIYSGVKIGSLSPIKIKGKKWGNGWLQKRKKTSLTKHEIIHVKKSLKNHASFLNEELVTKFLDKLDNRKP